MDRVTGCKVQSVWINWLMPNFSDRPALINSAALRLGELRKAGAIVPGEFRHSSLQYSDRDGNPYLTVEMIADLRAEAGYLELRHIIPDQAVGEAYRIRIIALPPLRGATRLAMICPVRGVKSVALYCPPGASQFASSRAHGLLVESDRLSTDDRAVYALHLARDRLQAARAKRGYRGGRGASEATLLRLRAAVADAELRAYAAYAKAQNKNK